MTGEQIFAVEPVALMFLLGLGWFFTPSIVRAFRWIDGFNQRRIGLAIMGIAVGSGLLLWLMS